MFCPKLSMIEMINYMCLAWIKRHSLQNEKNKTLIKYYEELIDF